MIGRLVTWCSEPPDTDTAAPSTLLAATTTCYPDRLPLAAPCQHRYRPDPASASALKGEKPQVQKAPCSIPGAICVFKFSW